MSPGLLSPAEGRSLEHGPSTITAAVINFNGRAVLPATLAALQRVRAPTLEIMVVDDGSTDGSPDWIRENHPEVRVIPLAGNSGKPSRGRNLALREARTRYVLLLDNDVVVEQDCPAALLSGMTAQPGVLCCTPRLLYADDPATIYYDGSDLHFLCVSTNSARGQGVADRTSSEPAPTIPGGNGLVDRQAALDLGLFDEGYDFGWGEDAELFIRGRIAGLQCLHIPDATATHAERERGVQRGEAQIYNRYRMLLTAYSRRSLLLLLPPLLTFELLLAAMGLAKGLGAAQPRSLRRIASQLTELRARRRRIQSTRQVPDGALLTAGDLRPTGVLNRSRAVTTGTRLLEWALTPYWKLVVQPLLGDRRGAGPASSRSAPWGAG
jgi:GT2 family glycosyltransferase